MTLHVGEGGIEEKQLITGDVDVLSWACPQFSQGSLLIFIFLNSRLHRTHQTKPHFDPSKFLALQCPTIHWQFSQFLTASRSKLRLTVGRGSTSSFAKDSRARSRASLPTYLNKLARWLYGTFELELRLRGSSIGCFDRYVQTALIVPSATRGPSS